MISSKKSKPINGFIDFYDPETNEKRIFYKRKKFIERCGEDIFFGPPSIFYIYHKSNSLFSSNTKNTYNTFHFFQGISIHKERSIIAYFSKIMKQTEENKDWLSSYISYAYEIKKCLLRIYNPLQRCDVQIKINCGSNESMIKESIISKDGSKKICEEKDMDRHWKEIYVSEICRSTFFYNYAPKGDMDNIANYPLFYETESESVGDIVKNVEKFLGCVKEIFIYYNLLDNQVVSKEGSDEGVEAKGNKNDEDEKDFKENEVNPVFNFILHACYIILKKYCLYNRIISFFPDFLEKFGFVSVFISQAHSKTQNNSMAISFLTDTIRLNPTLVEAICCQSKILYKEDNFKHSISLASTSLQIDPDYKVANLILSKINLRMNKIEEAFKHINKCGEENHFYSFFKSSHFLSFRHFKFLNTGSFDFTTTPKSIEYINYLEEQKLIEIESNNDLLKESNTKYTKLSPTERKLYKMVLSLYKKRDRDNFFITFRKLFGHSYKSPLVLKILKVEFGELPFESNKTKEVQDVIDDGIGVFSPQQKKVNEFWMKKRNIEIKLEGKVEEKIGEKTKESIKEETIKKNDEEITRDDLKKKPVAEKTSPHFERVLDSLLADLWAYRNLNLKSKVEQLKLQYSDFIFAGRLYQRLCNDMKKSSYYFSMAYKREMSDITITSNLFLRELINMHIISDNQDKFLLTSSSLILYNQKTHGCIEIDSVVRKGIFKFFSANRNHNVDVVLKKFDELKINNDLFKSFLRLSLCDK